MSRLRCCRRCFRKLIDKGKIRCHQRGGASVEFDVAGAGVQHRVVIPTDEVASARCSCPWHDKHGTERAPCKHILAALIQLEESHPEAKRWLRRKRPKRPRNSCPCRPAWFRAISFIKRSVTVPNAWNNGPAETIVKRGSIARGRMHGQCDRTDHPRLLAEHRGFHTHVPSGKHSHPLFDGLPHRINQQGPHSGDTSAEHN